jgi:transposase
MGVPSFSQSHREGEGKA